MALGSLLGACTQRLAEAGVVASVGSKSDSYDNAMTQPVTAPLKTS
ncbi:hypothetical protein ACQPYA_01455 [Micromonospora sp. CA-263727]